MGKEKIKEQEQQYQSNSEGEILVAVFNDTVYVKPFGFATQQNALGLPDFFQTMLKEGKKKVTFDLQECTAMDSTFLGVVATAALNSSLDARKNVIIINAGPQAKRQLQRIGLLNVVAFKEEPCQPPPDLQLSHIDFFHLPNSEKERIKRIKEVHEQLIQLNAKNQKNFAGFIEMLDRELEQSE